ncbi:SH3 domain-containing protein [Pseudomonas viridiflava]|uniref:SH3 domain-containing protein n=1 Tax=Pseudomonas viridiflava TaxID=33069 RepID=UPI001C317756|nr:SH3 domain-containing protein [Pseudomonas viridiflava]QXG50090.1 SH3 domain-containing protein [Pseudomonas viridiflava]
MRKKSRSWFIPLLILFAVLWAFGKKETPPAQAPLSQKATPNTLVSASSPAIQPAQTPPVYQFVNTDKLNLRDQPGGKVISTLQRGDKVQVYEKKDQWVRISADGQPAKWLSSKSLCNGASCYAFSKPEPVRTARPPAQPIPSQVPSYGSSCPCASGNVCIGPRGGRYCITSGGNKRYGV